MYRTDPAQHAVTVGDLLDLDRDLSDVWRLYQMYTYLRYILWPMIRLFDGNRAANEAEPMRKHRW